MFGAVFDRLMVFVLVPTMCQEHTSTNCTHASTVWILEENIALLNSCIISGAVRD